MSKNTSGLAILFKKASNKHKAGNFQAAEALYKKILKSDEKHIDANYMLGALYAEQNALKKALTYSKRAEELSPNSPYIKNNLGNIYRMTGHYPEAETCFLHALSLKPDLIEAYNNLAILYRRQKKYTEAIDLYKRALSVDPTFVTALYNLGKTLNVIERPDEAKDCFIEALKLIPEHALSHNELGEYYMRHGDKENAIYHFDKYLSLVKNDTCGVTLKLAYIANGKLPAKQQAEVVRQTYEIKASTWDQDIKRPNAEFLGPQLILEAVQKTIHFGRQLDILDIGCGTGICGELLLAYTATITGVDLSKHMLDIAKKKAIYNNLQCMDIEEFMESSDSEYDLIVGSGILIFIGDLCHIIELSAKILRPNSRFIFTVYKSENTDVSIRDNIHFAHSKQHIIKCARNTNLKVEFINEVIHEFDSGQAQAGYIVCLRN